MKSAKSLKSAAVDNPHCIGRTHNLRAVKHHLNSSDVSAQELAADAAVKLAFAAPSQVQKIRSTLEEVASRSASEVVSCRANRALSHIDSQLDAPPSQNTEPIDAADSQQTERTQLYQPKDTNTTQNYFSVCGTQCLILARRILPRMWDGAPIAALGTENIVTTLLGDIVADTQIKMERSA